MLVQKVFDVLQKSNVLRIHIFIDVVVYEITIL